MVIAKKIAFYVTLLITVFSISIYCSDDTADEPFEDFQTFLEKYDGTEWVLSNEDIKLYIRLNTDTLQLIEQWSFHDELNCYIYNPNILNPGNYKILENSANTLVIDCDAILGDCDYMTFRIQENTLMVDVKISEWEDEMVYFNQASQSVDILEKCATENDSNAFKFYH